jgi:hypothetical protein
MPPSPPPRDEGSPPSERVTTGGDEPDVGLASPPSVAHDDAPAVASALLARFRAVADDRVEELVTAQV